MLLIFEQLATKNTERAGGIIMKSEKGGFMVSIIDCDVDIFICYISTLQITVDASVVTDPNIVLRFLLLSKILCYVVPMSFI